MGDETMAVGAVIFDDDLRVLLVKRARPPGVGDWTLPGGHLQPGESLEVAVEREVLEETSLRVSAGPCVEVVHVAREGHRYAIHDFLCARRGNETPRAGDDASAVRWASRDELLALGVRTEAVGVIDRALAMASKRRAF